MVGGEVPVLEGFARNHLFPEKRHTTEGDKGSRGWSRLK
jgi:hypothetical protein